MPNNAEEDQVYIGVFQCFQAPFEFLFVWRRGKEHVECHGPSGFQRSFLPLASVCNESGVQPPPGFQSQSCTREVKGSDILLVGGMVCGISFRQDYKLWTDIAGCNQTREG